PACNYSERERVCVLKNADVPERGGRPVECDRSVSQAVKKTPPLKARSNKNRQGHPPQRDPGEGCLRADSGGQICASKKIGCRPKIPQKEIRFISPDDSDDRSEDD